MFQNQVTFLKKYIDEMQPNHKLRTLNNNMLLLSRFSRVQLLATPWTVAHQAPPSMGFSRQEY